MSAPIFDDTSEDLYARLPECWRNEDALLPVPEAITEVDRLENRSRDPRLIAEGGTNNGSLYPATRVADITPLSTGNAMLLTRTATTLNSTLASAYLSSPTAGAAKRITVTAAEVISQSVYVRTDQAGCQAQMRVAWRSLAGTTVRTDVSSATPLAQDTWTRLTQNALAAPESADYAFATVVVTRIDGANTVAGARVWVGAFMFHSGSVAQDYGDGGSAGWVWSDGVGPSTSIRNKIHGRDAGYPLKTWLQGVGLQLDEVNDVVERIDYVPPDEGDEHASELADVDAVDLNWLPWLGQFFGVNVGAITDPIAKRDAVRGGVSGLKAGTKAALAAAAASELTGTRHVEVYDHSIQNPGDGGEWDLMLVTVESETPDTANLLAAIIEKNAKPAGMLLHHKQFSSTWAEIHAAYPTWAAVNDKTWTEIHETGL